MVKKKNVKKLNDFKGKMSDAAATTKEKFIDAKDKVIEKARESRDKIEDVAKKTGRYIDKNPRKAAAIAAGIGAAIGAAIVAGTRKKRGFFR
ncbi:hypothetical protein J4423_03210 [Candidatus Pacearchaeota archaeon]|nr:hypothetical protein [Candidatus Pacearchaeota archaeon]